jgi:acetate kinase
VGSLLALNVGSSSLKFALFEGAGRPAALRGEIEDCDDGRSLIAHDAAGLVVLDRRWPLGGESDFSVALDALLVLIDDRGVSGGLGAVGHRLVHGGPDHIAPERVTPALLIALQGLVRLDPLHMDRNIAPIRALHAIRPDLPQVVCFDTAFHRTLPAVAARFALPRSLSETGIRRYGFHGLSYEYIAGRLAEEQPALAAGRVIVAHLGSGASLCALRGGVSIDTTMGFSPLDGLVMATRCGALDPGVILYLGRLGHSFAEIEDMLYRRSGLLGVSGVSGDLRLLLASGEPAAREAIDLFTYRVAGEAAAMASALAGLDGLVFTGGIGAHAPVIRAAVCERLAWLGLRLDPAANAANAACISAPGSAVDVRVMETNEETMIAHHTQAVIDGAAS